MFEKKDLDIFAVIEEPEKMVKFVKDFYSRKGGK